MISLPGFRSNYSADRIKRDGGLHYTTMLYRSPELILGGSAWGTPADCWAAGVIYAQMLKADYVFVGKRAKSVLCSIFRHTGTPRDLFTLEYMSKLPFWDPQLPLYNPMPYDRIVGRSLPRNSEKMLQGSWCVYPGLRSSVPEALECLLSEGAVSAVADPRPVSAAAPMEKESQIASVPPPTEQKLTVLCKFFCSTLLQDWFPNKINNWPGIHIGIHVFLEGLCGRDQSPL